MIVWNVFIISKISHLSYHYSLQISTNFIFKRLPVLSVESLGMPAHLQANREKSIHWQSQEQKKIFLKVMMQKRKANAPEEQGEMSRELVYLLGTLWSDHDGNVPVHCPVKSPKGKEGFGWLHSKDKLEKYLMVLGNKSCDINWETQNLWVS